jgi:cysteine desulfurase
MELQMPVYLDNNATTPVDQRVLDVMLPYFTQQFGNAASSSHVFGRVAADAVALAREQVAALIHAIPEEIVFTSGATESLNLALKGVFETYATKGNHIITCQTEHSAVLDTCRQLEKKGATVTYLPVDAAGLISLEALEAAITPQTILIVIMYGNNETGVLQPIKAIGALAKKHEVLFCCDATQALGKVQVDVVAEDIDLLAFSGHKIYGPKGVGALYVRRKGPRVQLTAQQNGGGHERGRRSGTLNVPGIAGLGKACALCREEMQEEALRLAQLRNQLETALLQLPAVTVNGDAQQRLPHVCNISFSFVDAAALMTWNKNIALSSGSACSSGTHEPSHVLKAMGLDDNQARNALRFSLGRFTTTAEIDYTVKAIKEGVAALRVGNPDWEVYQKTA